MPLSELKVRNARPAEKPQKLSDGGGMYMLVAVSGAKLWRMDYRFAEKRRTLSFGSYPDLSLAEARRRLEAARSLLAQGRDPGLQKKLDKIQARLSAANTFRSVAEEWLDKKTPGCKQSSSHYHESGVAVEVRLC